MICRYRIMHMQQLLLLRSKLSKATIYTMHVPEGESDPEQVLLMYKASTEVISDPAKMPRLEDWCLQSILWANQSSKDPGMCDCTSHAQPPVLVCAVGPERWHPCCSPTICYCAHPPLLALMTSWLRGFAEGAGAIALPLILLGQAVVLRTMYTESLATALESWFACPA